MTRLTTALTIIVLAGGGLAGCARPIAVHCDARGNPGGDREVHFGVFHELPPWRIGCLPCPGPFTLFEAADPDALGRHSYSGEAPDGVDAEVDRGIVYTCGGGFIDICHVRLSADLVAHLRPRLAFALEHDWPGVRLRGQDPSIFIVKLDYPPDWFTLDPAEKSSLVDELSIRMAQRVAYDMVTWHEIITFFGFKATGLISEHGSAFTYEDTPSHAFGVRIAGEALRAGGDYDEALTAALDDGLRRLGVVGADELERAIAAVEGDWWADGAVRKRHFDIGHDDGRIEPWLVPGFSSCAHAEAASFELPRLDDVDGRSFAGLYSVSIDPQIFEAGAIAETLPGKPARVRVAEHFPLLVQHIRTAVAADGG